MTRRMLWLLALPLLGYAGICAWMFISQRQMIYFPQHTRVAAASTDFALERDGLVLRGWVVNPGQARAIVYFGGNGESVQDNRANFARWLPGHSVYLLAYRGYGASEGQPAQLELLADALALFDRVQALHPEHPPAVIGRSLGSGVASHVAGKRPVSRLALVTPFDSLAAVAQSHFPWLPARWLVRERYPSVDLLQAYRGPLLIVRAGQDDVVPPANTDNLIAALPQPPHVVMMPEAGHNTLDDAVYGRALTEFFELQPRHLHDDPDNAG